MRKWTEEEGQFLYNLMKGSKGNRWTQWAKEFNDHFRTDRTWQQLRSYWRRELKHKNKDNKDNENKDNENQNSPIYEEEVEILSNGNVKSNKLIEMSEEDMKDPAYLLQAHGFDDELFELTNAKSSRWNHSNKEQGTMVHYSSKITVKPKEQKVNYNDLIDRIESKKEPYKPKVKPIISPDERYIVIPSFDTHFDGNTLEGYRDALGKILGVISKGVYKESLLILGGDIAHVDSINNKTTRGTVLDTTDLEATFDEMEEFYESIIEMLLKHSEKVNIMQLNGNHDATLGYMFGRILKRGYSNYSNINFDVSLDNRKVVMLGNNMICGSHGDKASKRYPQLFATEFAKEWAEATNRELFIGHLHHEVVIDEGGILQRQIPTLKQPDKWHTDNGFTMANHRFQIMTYTRDNTESVIYI